MSAAVRNLVRVVHVAAAIAVLAMSVRAAPAAAARETRWVCWHDSAKSISCILSGLRNADLAGMVNVPAEGMVRAPDHAARSKPLPPLVRAILHDPGSLTGRRISIPMFSEPEEQAFMIELAEAVMCGIKAECSVQFLGAGSGTVLRVDEIDGSALN